MARRLLLESAAASRRSPAGSSSPRCSPRSSARSSSRSSRRPRSADVPHSEIEDLFGHLEFIAPALAAAGSSFSIAGPSRGAAAPDAARPERGEISVKAGRHHRRRAGPVPAVPRLLPLRRDHLHRNAAGRRQAARGALQLRPRRDADAPGGGSRGAAARAFAAASRASLPSVALLDACSEPCSRSSPDLVALKWLSRWLESGRWYLFGIYCLLASVAVTLLHRAGY